MMNTVNRLATLKCVIQCDLISTIVPYSLPLLFEPNASLSLNSAMRIVHMHLLINRNKPITLTHQYLTGTTQIVSLGGGLDYPQSQPDKELEAHWVRHLQFGCPESSLNESTGSE